MMVLHVKLVDMNQKKEMDLAAIIVVAKLDIIIMVAQNVSFVNYHALNAHQR